MKKHSSCAKAESERQRGSEKKEKAFDIKLNWMLIEMNCNFERGS